jgi:hypothetical protein
MSYGRKKIIKGRKTGAKYERKKKTEQDKGKVKNFILGKDQHEIKFWRIRR